MDNQHFPFLWAVLVRKEMVSEYYSQSQDEIIRNLVYQCDTLVQGKRKLHPGDAPVEIFSLRGRGRGERGVGERRWGQCGIAKSGKRVQNETGREWMWVGSIMWELQKWSMEESKKTPSFSVSVVRWPRPAAKYLPSHSLALSQQDGGEKRKSWQPVGGDKNSLIGEAKLHVRQSKISY